MKIKSRLSPPRARRYRVRTRRAVANEGAALARRKDGEFSIYPNCPFIHIYPLHSRRVENYGAQLEFVGGSNGKYLSNISSVVSMASLASEIDGVWSW